MGTLVNRDYEPVLARHGERADSADDGGKRPEGGMVQTPGPATRPPG